MRNKKSYFEIKKNKVDDMKDDTNQRRWFSKYPFA